MRPAAFVLVSPTGPETYSLPLDENPTGPTNVLITHRTLFPNSRPLSLVPRNLKNIDKAKIWFFGKSNSHTSGETDKEKRKRHN